MRKAAWISLLLLMAAMLLLGEQKQMAPATRVAGAVSVIDGDTIAIRKRSIRILGIDAPELDQTCQDAAGQTWHCGADARHALAAHVARQQVSCHVAGQDRYGRDLARCATGGTDLAEWLVREGWAIPTGEESARYRAAGREAEASRTGIWAGSFMRSVDWRRAGDPQGREGAEDER
ncbi:thermonuclease family protein [Paracoccus actinidiae]|uniref:thermonuclease family protein n=1 Tax=Paracoccus actinidiae TaxID=3064531 RepID=UPI0027D34D36|nr:thermonuclease family protein [Paracoccus sp. M09]